MDKRHTVFINTQKMPLFPALFMLVTKEDITNAIVTYELCKNVNSFFFFFLLEMKIVYIKTQPSI